MECSEIELDAERLSCYDAAADAIKASLEKPQVGSSEQRQEQRNAEVAAIVFGEEEAPVIVEEVPEQITFIIKFREKAIVRILSLCLITSRERSRAVTYS